MLVFRGVRAIQRGDSFLPGWTTDTRAPPTDPVVDPAERPRARKGDAPVDIALTAAAGPTVGASAQVERDGFAAGQGSDGTWSQEAVEQVAVQMSEASCCGRRSDVRLGPSAHATAEACPVGLELWPELREHLVAVRGRHGRPAAPSLCDRRPAANRGLWGVKPGSPH